MGLLGFLKRQTGPLLHVASDHGEGHTVVLLHGLASSSVTFENLIPLLEGRFRVICVDLLGFGKSPNPPDASFTLGEHIWWLHRSLRRLKISGPFTLVGHSLGALIAARYAAQYPKELTHLILVAPPVYVPGETIMDPLKRLQVDALQMLYDFMRANPAFTSAGAKALAGLLPIKNVVELSEHNWRAFSLSLENCIESQTTVTDIAQVSIPVDLVYGTLDPFLALAGLRVVERMRGVATTRLDGMDHLIRPRFAKEIAHLIHHPSPPTAATRVVGESR